MMDRTLSIVKPDGVARGLIGEVVRRLEKKALKIVAIVQKAAEPPTVDEGYYSLDQGKEVGREEHTCNNL